MMIVITLIDVAIVKLTGRKSKHHAVQPFEGSFQAALVESHATSKSGKQQKKCTKHGKPMQTL
jgi:hypothetical protein